MGKRKKFENPSWASMRSKEPFTRIFDSMRESRAWRALKSKARALWIECARQANSGTNLPCKDFPDVAEFRVPDAFYMNRSLIDPSGLFGSNGAFYACLRELEEKGFIQCLRNGRNTRTKSVYRMSDAWKRWEPP